MIGYWLRRRRWAGLEERLAMYQGRLSIAESRLKGVRETLESLGGRVLALEKDLSAVEEEVILFRAREADRNQARDGGTAPVSNVIPWPDARGRLGLGDGSPPATDNREGGGDE